MIKKYIKKPVEIEALQYIGENFRECIEFMGNDFDKVKYDNVSKTLKINTLEGIMICSLNDYIIKGIKGEFYPCKPNIFKETYKEIKKEGNDIL